MVLGGVLVMLLVAAAPAFAQQGSVTATGVLGEPYTEGEDPTVQYPFTDEETGEDYVLTSGFVDLGPYVGQRITIEAAPIGTAPGATQALNVTDVIESESGYDPAPLAVITGEIQALAKPITEGGTHTITEASTGDVYTLWSDTQYTGVDLSQYEGQNVTVYGIFQTLGNPLSSFPDPTEVPIAVTSVESLEPLPVSGSSETTFTFALAVEGQPPADATFFARLNAPPLIADYPGVIQLTDPDDDGIYTATETAFRAGDQITNVQIVRGTGVQKVPYLGDIALDYPGEPVQVIEDFGTVTLEEDTTLSASVSFATPPPEDQYTDSPDQITLLPDTGGFSPAVLVALLLLSGGGLLAYSLARQR